MPSVHVTNAARILIKMLEWEGQSELSDVVDISGQLFRVTVQPIEYVVELTNSWGSTTEDSAWATRPLAEERAKTITDQSFVVSIKERSLG